MAWVALSTSSALTLTSAWQTIQQSSADMVVGLNPRELAQVMVEVVFQSSPTDDAEYQVLSSPDDGTTWDTMPILAGAISNPGTVRVTFELLGVESFKVQMKQTGATDTTNAGKVYVRKDGVSAT